MAPYRPPGRSNRSGRTQADNDIFEGLPVKQWTHTTARISLAPPVSEVQPEQAQDRWAEPPMPRDYQLLQPYTQQMLRLARSGKVGQKRKSQRETADANGDDFDARDDDANHNDEPRGGMLDEDRALVAKKWKHVPDHSLVPEHLHWEFLAKRRKGLPNFYYGSNSEGIGLPVPMRKTRVSKIIDAVTGDVAVYDVLAPEGQSIENEVVEGSELAGKESTTVAAGTVVEGVGVANDDGVLVMEVRNAAAMAQRRNRPPPKKKGGPGRGKKRVTFTNPDGSTYTTIVPNATKIVPQPGQTVKHVAKGEEAARDITAEEAARLAKLTADSDPGDGEEDGDDDGDEDGDDDDDEGEDGEEEGEEGAAEGVAEDREEGELADEDAVMQDAKATRQQDATMQDRQGDDEKELEKATQLAAVTVPASAEPEIPGDGAQNVPEPQTQDLNEPAIPDTNEKQADVSPPQALSEPVLDTPQADVAMPDAEAPVVEAAGEEQAAGSELVSQPDAKLEAAAAPESIAQQQETQDELPSDQNATLTADPEQPFVLPGITHSTPPKDENEPSKEI